jgi:hypothetical protein
MPFLTDLPAKLKEPAGKAAEFVAALGGKVFKTVSRFAERLRALPPEKQRALVIGLGALLAVLALGSALMLAAVNRPGPVPGGTGGAPERIVIPPEELFLPGEPDFVPPILLDREPEKPWTGEDARPYWRDPLKRGEEPWRERIESVIDEMLERVP